jgi:hypothetical protein
VESSRKSIKEVIQLFAPGSFPTIIEKTNTLQVDFYQIFYRSLLLQQQSPSHIEVMSGFPANSQKAECVEIMAEKNFDGMLPIGASKVWVSKVPTVIVQLATPHKGKTNVCLMAALYNPPEEGTAPSEIGIDYELRTPNNIKQLRALAKGNGIYQGVQDHVYDESERVVMWFTICKYESYSSSLLLWQI